MRSSRSSGLLVLTAFALTLPATAATRLTYEINGKNRPISWAQPSVPWSPATNLTADTGVLRRSFDAWSSIDSGLRFREATPSSAAPGRDGVNLVTLADDLRATSGFLAFTTAWFDDDGRVEEADIQIDREAAGLGLEQLLVHEIGHFSGLDHSGVIGSAMFPFVATDRPLKLDTDDVIAIRSIYPSTSAKTADGVIRGTVRSSSGPVWGAHVVATDARGHTVATTLSGQDGAYSIGPLASGSYRLFAEPMDGPVSRSNFSGVWQRAGTDEFTTRFEVTEVRVGPGQTSDVPIVVAAVSPALNPRWIGTFETGAGQLALNSMAATVKPGAEINLAVGGDGFESNTTTFEVASPDLERISGFTWGSSWVAATFRVAPNAEPASLSVTVINGAERASLTGSIRIDGEPSDDPPPTRRRATSRG
ncbi:MAG: matrixin family metalloprotease [Acidobacteria bacterium]|nr:matrixin family metalloprotease [Acidobacteriota bacterium]